MARVLVSETIADGGLERLRQAGHTVDVSTGLSPEELLTAVKGAHALIIRSVARNIPQSHSALTSGRWERSKWEGVELADKVLGIVGLGRIGKLVAQRAYAFGMRVIAHDPFVSPDR